MQRSDPRPRPVPSGVLAALVACALLAAAALGVPAAAAQDGAEPPAPSATAPPAPPAPPATAPPAPPAAPAPAALPPTEADVTAVAVDLASVDALLAEARARARALRVAQVAAAAEQVRAAAAVVAEGVGRLDGARAAEAAAAGVVAEREAEVETWRRRISGFVVDAYMKVGTDRDSSVLQLTAGTEGGAEAVDAQQLRIYTDEAIDATKAELAAARSRLADARAARAAAAEVVAERVAEVDRLRAVEADARRAEAELRAAPLPVPEELAADVAATTGPTILGATLVGAEDLAAFVRARGTPHPTVDVDALAAAFVDEGRAEGVRADLAWVQSIIETGWFGFAGSMVDPSDHNYAGIGACDSCTDGFSYGTPQLGARAQVQLLRAYADPSATAGRMARPSVNRDPARLGVRGCCPTWMALSGVWATGPGYGVKILTLYNELLRFAVDRQRATG